MSKTKKQSKADKDFIAKIATIGINMGAAPAKTCTDCGKPMAPVGMLVGQMNGQSFAGPVYGHGGVRPEHFVDKSERSDERSFSA